MTRFCKAVLGLLLLISLCVTQVALAEAPEEYDEYDAGEEAFYAEDLGDEGEGAAETADLPEDAGEEAAEEAAPKKKPTEKAELEEDGELVTVDVVKIGTLETIIKRDGEKVTVPTADLIFSERVSKERALAIVYAPRTGKATLRAKASKSSKGIKECKAGQMVAVLEIGDTYTLVNANGKMGYLLTAALTFQPVNAETKGYGVLSVNGKATGKQTVNVRAEAKKKSLKLAEWKTGIQVPIFAEEDGWYEVEYDGRRGWVMADYLTFE